MKYKIGDQFKIGTILSYISIFISLGSGLILTPFIIKSLSTSEYGLYSLVGSLVGYISILEGGIGTTVVRYISKYKSERNKKDISNLVAICKIIYAAITIFIFIIGTLIYFNIDKLFLNSMSYEELKISKMLFIILLLNLCITTYFSMYNAVIVSYEKFIFNKLVSIVFSVMKIILTILLLERFPSAIFLTIITMITGIISNTINYVYANKLCKGKLYYLDKNLFRKIFKFTLFNFIQIIIYQVYWKIDELLIGLIISTSAVAIYSVASTLNGFIINFSTAICTILLPSVTEIRDKSKIIVTQYISKISSIIAVLYLLIVSGFIVFGNQFIDLWVGDEYSIVYNILMILIVSNFVNIVQEPLFVLARASNKHGRLNIILLITSILNIILTIYLINKFGIIGATIGTSMAILFGNTLIGSIYFAKSLNIDMRLYYKNIFSYFKFHALILLPLIVFYKYISNRYIRTWISLLIGISTYTIIYIITYMIIKKVVDSKLETSSESKAII